MDLSTVNFSWDTISDAPDTFTIHTQCDATDHFTVGQVIGRQDRHRWPAKYTVSTVTPDTVTLTRKDGGDDQPVR